MKKSMSEIVCSFILITVSISSLALSEALIQDPIFSAFTIIERRVEEFKTSSDRSKIQQIKNEFDTLLGNELVRDANILTKTGPFGLTPAHFFVLQYLLLTKKLQHMGTDLWKGQSEIYKELFEYAFSKLNTDKIVQAQKTGQSSIDMSYLKRSGITEKPMSANQLRDAFILGDKIITQGKQFRLTELG